MLNLTCRHSYYSLSVPIIGSNTVLGGVDFQRPSTNVFDSCINSVRRLAESFVELGSLTLDDHDIANWPGS
jgi:hypothetical protein